MKCLPNIAQIPNQEGKTWEVQSAVAALQHKPASPKEGEYLPSGDHQMEATPYSEPWGIQDRRP